MLSGINAGIILSPNPNRWAIIVSTLGNGAATIYTDSDDPVNGGVLIPPNSNPWFVYFTQLGRWVQSGFGVRNDSAVNTTVTLTEIIYVPPP